MKADLRITCQAVPGTEPGLTVERAFSETTCQGLDPCLGLSRPAYEMGSSLTRPPTSQGQRARLSVGNSPPSLSASQCGPIFSLVSRSCCSYLSWYFWHVLANGAPPPTCASSAHRTGSESCARVLPPTQPRRHQVEETPVQPPLIGLQWPPGHPQLAPGLRLWGSYSTRRLPSPQRSVWFPRQ